MQRTVKVVFVGESGVGKTSIINAFLGKEISNISTTIGVDFYSIPLQNKKVIVWDFAGQEWFRRVIIDFLTGASVIVMVFDLSRPETLLKLLEEWANHVETLNKEASVIVVGNKSDIKSTSDDLIVRVIDELKKRLNVRFYIETSALLRKNIPAVFDAILEAITVDYHIEKLKKQESAELMQALR